MQAVQTKHSLRKKIKIRHKGFWIYAGIALVLIAALNGAARLSPSFAEGHARYIYPLFVQTLGRVSAIFPFSLFEVLVAAAICYLLAGLVVLICHLVTRRGSRGATLYAAFRRVFALALAVLLLFTMTAEIQYQRAPFSSYSGLTVRKTDVDELKALCTHLRDQLTEDAVQIETDENGVSVLHGNIDETAVEAMHALGETYPVLAGYYPRPKPVFCSIVMSYSNISGIYSPFTVEANYNRLITPYNIPLTVCHELSHLRGFMREDEANFIAYLACIKSGNLEFRYSGSMLAFLYATNALWNAGEQELYQQLFDSLPAVVRADYRANDAYWKQFETPVAEVANQVNDTYLKANAQEDGVQSYGRMVDLLIAYDAAEQKN